MERAADLAYIQQECSLSLQQALKSLLLGLYLFELLRAHLLLSAAAGAPPKSLLLLLLLLPALTMYSHTHLCICSRISLMA
jgi:hypothetical protein